MKNILVNPVLQKEFKLRFRSIRTLFGLLAYLLVIAIIVVGFILIESVINGSQYVRPEESRIMFTVLAFLQLGLILFITPGLTAGVISGEREKQTLNILLTTTQSSISIIMSKLLSSISYLVLLIFVSLPFYSIVFLYGGVSPITLLKMLGFYVFSIFVFGSFGIFFSTLVRRTIVAMITSYGVTLFMATGTAFLFTVFISMTYSQQSTMILPYIFSVFNPVIAFSMVFEPGLNESISDQTGIGFPVLWAYFIVYSILSAIALWVSIRKLRPNMKHRNGG